MIAWQDLLSALALVLVLEGILPFANPSLWRRAIATAARLSDSELRRFGVTAMAAGLVMLYVVH